MSTGRAPAYPNARARRREARARGERRAIATDGLAPTKRQLEYLSNLCARLGRQVPAVGTQAAAGAEIARLRRIAGAVADEDPRAAARRRAAGFAPSTVTQLPGPPSSPAAPAPLAGTVAANTNRTRTLPAR